MANEIGSTLLNTLTNSSFDVGNMAKVLAEASVAGPRSIMERSEQKISKELNALTYLQNNLKAFNSYAKELASPSLFSSQTVTSSDATVVGASITGSPVAGTYNIESMQLAQAHTMVANKTYASQYDTVAMGTMQIQINGQTHNITVDASNNTLEGLQRTINNGSYGVTASIVNNGGVYQMMFSSAQTGAASAFTVSGLTDFAAPADFTVTSAAQDAQMKLNGLLVSSSTNSFSGVVDGLSFQLNAASVGSVKTVTVAQDSSGVAESIKEFVDVYNQLDLILKDLGSYEKLTAAQMEDPEKEFTGDLAGSSLLRDLKTQIKDALTGVMSGSTSPYNSLASIGISMDRYGQLQLDEAALNTALSSDISSIAGMLASGGSASDAMVSVTGTNEKTLTGSYALNVTQLAERATVSSGALVPDVNGDIVLAADGSFDIKVDGSGVATVNIAAGTYTAAEFAALMNTSINNNATIQASGAQVSVTTDGSLFSITSNRFGANSVVEMSNFTNMGNAGFGANLADIGQNVDGTLTMSNGSTLNIGAYADATDGRKVKISDFAVAGGEAADVRGLEFEVLGGAVGARGTIDVTQGFAGRVFELINNATLTDTGLVAQRIDSLSNRMGEIEEKRVKIDLRFEKMELKYRMQFSMLQSIMSQMKGTQDFLTATYNRPAQ